MKGMLADVQLLACEHGMKTATKAQQQQISQAIAEVSAIPASALQGSSRGDAQACLTALFLTDPRDDREKLVNVKGSRVDGTCKWIKTNALYNSWLCSHSQLLWLSGSPGKGKTILAIFLAIFLAEELEQIAKHSHSTLFSQYFCDNKDEKRNTAATILRGLIYQLLQSRPKLFDHILPSFQTQRESMLTSWSFETLWRIFETMIHDPVLGITYCVLDGLDECDGASLELLLIKFRALFSMNSGEYLSSRLNLIVVSRDFPDFIPEVLSNFPRIRLDSDTEAEVNDNIHQFIEVKVNELSIYRQYPEPLRVHVKEVFQSRAQGTFLWVGILAKALRKYKASEVEKALDLFPPGLEELYARMLLQIDIDRREIAAKILCWVVMAVRPLTLAELSAAIETAVKPSIIFNRDEVIRDQISYCGYFLTIKEDQVGLIHQSAKDYLLRKGRDSNPELEFFRVKEEPGNLEIARKCLGYLQNGALINGEGDLLENATCLKTFPLLEYAVFHCPEHARSLARSEDIFDLSLPFYHKKSQARISWLKTYRATGKQNHLPSPESFTPLHLASFFGILPLAENLLLKKGFINRVKRLHYVNKMDGYGRTALCYAARGGHEALVRLLLEKGAEIEFKGRRGGLALPWAAGAGREAVVQLLLEKGADTEAKSVLLQQREKGTDAKATSRLGGAALIWAVVNGHITVVRLLLEKGADIEAKGGNGYTALHFAVMAGHEAAVRLLLERKANVEAKCTEGKTVLFGAVVAEHEAIVRLLLEKGADLGAKDETGWTVLFYAASSGYEAIVRLLLNKGAGIEAKDKDESTGLFYAASSGYEAAVQLLLEKGADLEAKAKTGWTALSCAASSGHEAVVRLLLGKGADIEAKDDIGLTALGWAALGGHAAIVRLLLEKGADIEAKDKSGGTALFWAAEVGHKAVVRLLLEMGANFEAKDVDGRIALYWAAERGHEAAVQLLTPFNLKS